MIDISAPAMSGKLTPRPTAQPSAQVSALERAYEELDELLEEYPPDDPNEALEQRLDAAWARLETLHAAAHDQLRADLDKSVAIPPHKLATLLDELRADLDNDEP